MAWRVMQGKASRPVFGNTLFLPVGNEEFFSIKVPAAPKPVFQRQDDLGELLDKQAWNRVGNQNK